MCFVFTVSVSLFLSRVEGYLFRLQSALLKSFCETTREGGERVAFLSDFNQEAKNNWMCEFEIVDEI